MGVPNCQLTTNFSANCQLTTYMCFVFMQLQCIIQCYALQDIEINKHHYHYKFSNFNEMSVRQELRMIINTLRGVILI